jgi:hypothetical protein
VLVNTTLNKISFLLVGLYAKLVILQYYLDAVGGSTVGLVFVLQYKYLYILHRHSRNSLKVLLVLCIVSYSTLFVHAARPYV